MFTYMYDAISGLRDVEPGQLYATHNMVHMYTLIKCTFSYGLPWLLWLVASASTSFSS